eukprot:scaffold28724_cov68-Phaeocystis_antarctica.AAC.1
MAGPVEAMPDAEPSVWVCTLCICTLASLEDGGGATGGAAGATDGAASVVGGAGVAGSGGWTRPGTAVVVGAAGRHTVEVGAQACIPPRRLAGSGVNPTLYLAFSASGSALHCWPGEWHGAGESQGRAAQERGWVRVREGPSLGLGTGGMRSTGEGAGASTPKSLSRSPLAMTNGIRSGRCSWQYTCQGLVNVVLARRAEADSGRAGLLGGAEELA